jgi:MoaA/NifB/PqqE/SkfB family radical SAM enzyme
MPCGYFISMDSAMLKSIVKKAATGHAPGQLVLQITERCNAKCPQCGMRISSDFPRKTLSETEAKKIIDQAAKNGIEFISFTGGEPFLYPDLLVKLINHASENGIKYTRTGTNGFFFAEPERPDFKDKIKKIVDTLFSTQLRNFWISIDSCNTETHETMRGFNGLIKGIENALPLFHDAGIYPAANIGINRNICGDNSLARTLPVDEFKDNFTIAADDFFSFIINTGFTTINMCYPMSENAPSGPDHKPASVYAATSTNELIRFTDNEKSAMFAVLTESIAKYRSRIRIFTPRSSLYSLSRAMSGETSVAYPCRGGIDFFFASVNGDIYPCGYRGKEPLTGSAWKKTGEKPACRKCEWECFRDPSALFGPVEDLFLAPWRLVKRISSDLEFMKIWIEDLRYYRACDFFDGRKKPDYPALLKFDCR